MHFICSTFGSSGDVFPLLGLALELQSRGHEITFATNAHYATLSEQLGLRFVPLGTEEAFFACINHPDLWHPQRAFRHVVTSLRPALREQYELHAAAAGRRDTVAITNCFGFGALLAQDKHAVPVITLHCQPAALWSDLAPPTLPGLCGPRWLKSLQFRVGERFFLGPAVLPFLNAWRRELGLPPVAKIARWWNSPYGVLAMFPPWFAQPQPDWPQPLMQTDFPLWNRNSSEGLEPAVEQFLQQGSPPIVFTPGSTNLHGQKFFQAALSAIQQVQGRAIFLTEHPAQLPANLPATIAHFRYVPLDLVLPRAAAFVHHGGIGSTSQALLAGVPQVLMPLAHDQFDNAQRVRKMGVGDSIPASRFASAPLASMLRRLLAANNVATACRRYSQKLAARGGLRQSADAVLNHVQRAQSMVST